MPFSTVPDKSAGDIFTEVMWDTYIRDNINYLQPAYGTTLPASPTDGQQAVLVDSTTNPTYIWQFRYNAGSTSTYKWEFVGGSPATATRTPGTSTTTLTAAYVDLADGAGPSFTTPRAGDYWINLSCAVNDSAVQSVCNAGVGIGAFSIPILYGGSFINPAGSWTGAAALGVGTDIAASSELRMRYYQGIAGTFTAKYRTFSVLPIRVS
jgi:hypothetical protein